MRRTTRRLLTLLTALTAVATPALATRAQAQEMGIAVGEQAPGGPVETLAGQKVEFSRYLGTQPVVIEFWATWCGNCKQLEPAMRAAMKKHAGTVRFVTVAVSINQSLARVKAWQAQHQLPGEIVYDRQGTVSGAYDAPATSYVVVVNKAGKIVYTGLGGSQDLEAAIRKAS